MNFKLPLLLLIGFLLLPSLTFANSGSEALVAANRSIVLAIQSAQHNDLAQSKREYDQYNSAWYSFEAEIKSLSKGAYRDIEEAMGEVQFAYAQQPPSTDKILNSLDKLNLIHQKVISGDLSSFKDPVPAGNATVEGLLLLLDQAGSALDRGDAATALEKITAFRSSWLDVEGIVLTQSSRIYGDAERDMVSAYALLTANPPKLQDAKDIISEMRSYLAPVASKTSYTILDVITILLREGLEALLVIVALLGFLNKSGHGDKKKWIWSGLECRRPRQYPFRRPCTAAVLIRHLRHEQFSLGGLHGIVRSRHAHLHELLAA